MDAYHTALPGGVETDAEPLDLWASGGSKAFVHNLACGLPHEMLGASFIYGEPPWIDGYDEFHRRAGVTDAPTFAQFMYRLNGDLHTFRKPWMVLVGHAAARHLGCEWMRPASLHGSLCALIGARCPPPPPELIDTGAILQWLSGNPEYAVVGDFCAGYGRTARTWAKAGKRFIASDINPRCIGHIAREFPNWTE